MTDWSIDAGHFAERFQLLIIIALGESIVVMGSTASKSDLGGVDIAAVLIAFATTVAMWWLYFNFVAERALERMRTASAPERMARDAFTYLHIPIVAGIILAAVADEVLIAHPSDPFPYPIIAVAGPFIYLLGHNLFRLSMARSISMNRLIAMFALLAVVPLGDTLSALQLSAVVLGILIALIVREEMITVAPLKQLDSDTKSF
jgi:low temperature requirement protein LtrA